MAERQGMSYNEGRTRVMRMTGNSHGNAQMKANLVNSIVNQVRIREGAGAAKEIIREMRMR